MPISMDLKIGIGRDLPDTFDMKSHAFDLEDLAGFTIRRLFTK
jgi:hypothetical protein